MKLHSRRWTASMAASCLLGAAVWVPPASAQTVTPNPKARYDRDIARCTRGNLPAPAREACVREAGLAFDRATGGVTGTRQTTSPDGRATVIEPSIGTVEPAGARPGAAPSPSLVTTPDGRATVVVPPVP